MEKNYNFNLIFKKYNKTELIFKLLIKAVVFGLFVMLLTGYFMGYRVFTVLGWSSEPDIHYGSVVIDYKVPFEELKVGDYVTWSRNGAMNVTHIIISIDKANKTVTTSQTSYGREEGEEVSPDAPVTYDQIKGKVIATIPELGNIMLSLKNLVLYRGGINILGVMSIVLSISAYYIFKGLINKETFILREY